jgi:CRP-like cAMP-binding protein
MHSNHAKNPVKVYQRSEVIFEENSIGHEMYILRSGKVQLVLGYAERGAEVCTLERPGEFFGEMALVDASPRSATAIAEEDNTELEVLSRENFLKTIREHPEFALDLMSGLSKRVRQGNILYLEMVRTAMTKVCPLNCLEKAMEAFVREGTPRSQE